jgi:hypothetical protein
MSVVSTYSRQTINEAKESQSVGSAIDTLVKTISYSSLSLLNLF